MKVNNLHQFPTKMDPENVTPQDYANTLIGQSLFTEHHKRSANEQLLFEQWHFACLQWEKTNNLIQHLQRENHQLGVSIQQLNSQLSSLQTQISGMNQPGSSVPRNTNDSDSEVQFQTDEEELAKETEWIRKKNRKSRNVKNKTFKITPQENKSKPSEKKDPKEFKPPPIIVEGIDSYEDLYNCMASKLDESFQIKLINDTKAKISCSDSDTYRDAVKELEAKNINFHSYENKQTRAIRVMVKNLHHSFKTDNIVTFLKDKGYKIITADVKLSWKEKKPLNMFELTFQNEEDINKIYNIKQILGCKVEIDSIRNPKLIPQCKNCQQYGHTRTYCNRESRCVKCPGKHLTANCTKTDSQKPKCVNCGEEHPANYRGCMVARELQNIKIRKSKKKDQINSREEPNQEQSKPVREDTKIHNKSTYASVVASGSDKRKPEDNSRPSESNVLQLILNKLTKLEERVSGIEKLSNILSSKC